MKCKIYFIVTVFCFIHYCLHAQCYIQYTYNASGHQIKREYVGGCGRPASKDDMEEMVKHAVSDSIAGIRSELIRKDLDSKIRVYPNFIESTYCQIIKNLCSEKKHHF
jgi:hypothetical protein